MLATLADVLDAGGDYDAQVALISQELDRLIRRLRGLSPLAWRTRREAVEEMLGQIERTTAALERRPARSIPTIPEHALADAVAVLGNDVLRAIFDARDAVSVSVLIAALRTGLSSTQ